MPTVEEIVRRKQRACFIVHPIADDAERIVFHQFRNISSVADALLFVSIINRNLFFYRCFKLKNHHRNPVDIQNQIRNP